MPEEIAEEQIPGQMEVEGYPELMPEKPADEVPAEREKTPQSDEESNQTEREEIWYPEETCDLRLKPCPFCGSKQIAYIKYKTLAGERWKVTCFGCMATIDPGYAQMRSIVQEMWNRRDGVKNA